MIFYGDYEDEVSKKMKNRPLQSVTLNAKKDKITFLFLDGYAQSFVVAGDCCSESWIEHLTLPDDLPGAIITDIEDSGVEEIDSPDHECLKVYQTYFKTNKGTITLEYRNSSNGYYGGYLVPVGER